eukprot:gene35881-34996_t
MRDAARAWSLPGGVGRDEMTRSGGSDCSACSPASSSAVFH